MADENKTTDPMEWRVDMKGYPVTVLGKHAHDHLEQMNREYGRMRMALHRILHMKPEEWGAQGIFHAQKLAGEGLGKIRMSDKQTTQTHGPNSEGLEVAPKVSQTTADLIVDYVRRAPVRIVNVASHFGMALRDAHLALVELEEAGRIEPCGRDQWRISR